MSLIVQDYNTIVTAMITRLSANTNVSDYNPGSVIRTFFEAVAVPIDETYFQLVEMLNGFYINSATGSDLDKRLSDYGLQRYLAQPSTLTLSFTSVLTTIPAGTLVDLQAFSTTPTLSFVTTSAGSPGNSIPAICTTPGSVGNIPLTFSPAYVWTVVNSNGNQITAVVNTSQGFNGANQESDDQFRARGIAYLQSLSKATNNAIIGACKNAVDSNGNSLGIKVASVLEQYSLTYISGSMSGNQLNQDLALNPSNALATINTNVPGSIVVVVDNGQGGLGFANVIPSLVSIINGDPSQPTVFPGYRAAGIQAFMTRTATVTPSISVALVISPTVLTTAPLIGAVQSALSTYINQLPIGTTLYRSDIVDICMNIDNVVDVPFSTIVVGNATEDYTLASVTGYPAVKITAPTSITVTVSYPL